METKDLIVIGGGINGAGIAADAAGRGLSVLMLEAQDLACATSSASSKLIHGGLRYHVSNYQPSPMVRMMKADAAPVSAQETYEQAAIQFDDQVDVVFQLEPVDQQPAKTPAAQ